MNEENQQDSNQITNSAYLTSEPAVEIPRKDKLWILLAFCSLGLITYLLIQFVIAPIILSLDLGWGGVGLASLMVILYYVSIVMSFIIAVVLWVKTIRRRHNLSRFRQITYLAVSALFVLAAVAPYASMFVGEMQWNQRREASGCDRLDNIEYKYPWMKFYDSTSSRERSYKHMSAGYFELERLRQGPIRDILKTDPEFFEDYDYIYNILDNLNDSGGTDSKCTNGNATRQDVDTFLNRAETIDRQLRERYTAKDGRFFLPEALAPTAANDCSMPYHESAQLVDGICLRYALVKNYDPGTSDDEYKREWLLVSDSSFDRISPSEAEELGIPRH